MNSLNNNKINTIQKTSQKDIEKGQKILAAIYLVTSHLSDTEPIRQTLRSLATKFVCVSLDSKELAIQIEMVLGGAVFAGLISQKNSSVIVYEVKHFSETRFLGRGDADLGDIFSQPEDLTLSLSETLKDIKKTNSFGLIRSNHGLSVSHSETPQGQKKGTNNKSLNSTNVSNHASRQEIILSFINDRKSAVIKDIISLFPDVSEKTIQRELGSLIDAGRITKRGSKRWSMYMAVNSLL